MSDAAQGREFVMEGRWTIPVDKHGPGIQVAVGDGWQMVPVVPCDDAAVKRAGRAIYDTYGQGDAERSRRIAEAVLRAAGETP